jgi:putative transposase
MRQFTPSVEVRSMSDAAPGASTRRVEKLVQKLDVERMSRSQISQLAKSLDAIVDDFRPRELDGAPYAYVEVDALVR